MAFGYERDEFSRIGDTTVILSELAARWDAPFYFYDGDAVLERAAWFTKYSRAKIHFAMKSNAEIHLLSAMARAGYGVDVVSFGEVEKAMQADFKPARIIYSGVAKSESDLSKAMQLGIGQINVESLSELDRIVRLAESGAKPIRVALRMNLAMDVPTHPYIQTSAKRSKFGLAMNQLSGALTILSKAKNVRMVGLSAHIGSQIADLGAFKVLGATMRQMTKDVLAQGFRLETIDLGGGLGIDYLKDEDDEPRVRDYLKTLAAEIQGLDDLSWALEPGRILTARAGVLVAKVEYVKKTPDAEFLILNTGTHHLIRPALYGALHRIQPLRRDSTRASRNYDVVGLLCESSDCFAKDYSMPEMREGEWVAIRDAGAYGRVMASCYNESPLPREVIALGGKVMGAE